MQIKTIRSLDFKTLLECRDNLLVQTNNWRNTISSSHYVKKPKLIEASLGLHGWIPSLRPPVETFWTWETTRGEEKRKYWFGRDSSECVGLEDFHITPTSQTYTFQRMLPPPRPPPPHCNSPHLGLTPWLPGSFSHERSRRKEARGSVRMRNMAGGEKVKV